MASLSNFKLTYPMNWNQSATQFFLKAFITYYAIQILVVQYQTFKLHWEPPPLQTMNATTITERKIQQVYEERSHLVKSQMNHIQKTIAKENISTEDLPDQISRGERETLLSGIHENLKRIKILESEMLDLVRQSPLPKAPEKGFDEISPPWVIQNMSSSLLSFHDLESFLSQESFVHYTDDELVSLRERVSDSIVSTANHCHVEVDKRLRSALEYKDTNCEKFLSRAVSSEFKKQFVTRDVLQSLIETLKAYLQDIQQDPLNAETKILITRALIKKSQQRYVEVSSQVDSLIEDLKEFATRDLPLDHTEDRNGCASLDDIHRLLKIAIAAHREKKHVHNALAEIVGDWKELYSTPEQVMLHNVDDEENAEATNPTLKDLLSSPLFPKLFEKIDASVERIAGFNDVVDRWIDAMGGSVEGGVGKKLESIFHRVTRKVEIPRAYFGWTI